MTSSIHATGGNNAVVTLGAMSAPPRKQHTVSQVLLRRWATKGDVVAVDLTRGRAAVRSTRAEAYEEFFVRPQFARAIEQVWQDIESEAPTLMAAVDSADRALPDEAKQGLARLVALHVVRSRGFRAMAGDVTAQGLRTGPLAEILQVLADDSAVAALGEERTGIRPAGPEGVALAREREVQRLDEQFGDGGQFFVDQLLRHYERTVDVLASREIEIGRATAGEFVIGDNPAVPFNQATGKWGFPNGARVDTGRLVMPVSPTLLLSVGGPGGTFDLDARFVDFFNEVQVRNAVKKVYARQGSGLDEWVLALRGRIVTRATAQ